MEPPQESAPQNTSFDPYTTWGDTPAPLAPPQTNRSIRPLLWGLIGISILSLMFGIANLHFATSQRYVTTHATPAPPVTTQPTVAAPPRLLAAWQGNPSACPAASCQVNVGTCALTCQGFYFSAPTVFRVVIACTLDFLPADAPPPLTYQLYASDGTLVESVSYPCGGSDINEPTIGTQSINVTAKTFPAGPYALQISAENADVNATVLILAA